MRLLPVTSAEDEKRFIRITDSLYQNVPAWIRPMDEDIRSVFDPKTNKTFQYGECMRWLLVADDRVLGRIAAFITQPESGKKNGAITGGVGFFECVDNQEAANTLFDAARQWIQERGATYMDGPVNFGRRDKWWGLLTRGFEEEPDYQCNFHLPYYKTLFDGYGFQEYYNQFTYKRQIIDPISPKLVEKADRIAADPAYSFRHFKRAEFDRYAKDIIDVYNKAWVNHEGVNPISVSQGMAMFKRLKPILDEKIIWLAYHSEEPVAIFVNIPEVNQWLKHIRGPMNLWGKIQFLWFKKVRPTRKMLGIIFGVVPEYQGKGVDGAIIRHFQDYVSTHLPYEAFEMNGIGDFNPKMIKVAEQVGGDVIKVHTTYRYLFDREAPFQRMTRIG